MAESAVLRRALPVPAATPQRAATGTQVAITVTSRFADVEDAWRALSATGPMESPGQSFDFVRLWADRLRVAETDRVLVAAHIEDQPIALLPLKRRKRYGVDLLSWFPGPHVGCNAPIVDMPRLLALHPEERAALWQRMTSGLAGADLVYLPAVPDLPAFGELGFSTLGDTLYRAQFSSWENANSTQRSKSRRKHDRQQGERLDALGAVSFEEVAGGPEAAGLLDCMFRQRAARFRTMGVDDPFADPQVRAFYRATLDPTSGVVVRLHVLRLDGEVIAIRYNIVEGSRMFCLISSMSDDPRVQTGSPGKQCLLRVMQTVFEAGYCTFDMGAGFTDEKRHWCNVPTLLWHHYLPLNAKGRAAALTHRQMQTTRREIKANRTLLGLAKRVRAATRMGKGQGGEAGE